MTRRLLVWTVVEGVIALSVGGVTTYLVSQRGDLAFHSWVDFVFLAMLIAGIVLAIWRPTDAAIAYGGMSWVLVIFSLESVSSAGQSADPLLATLCGVVLITGAVVGSRRSLAGSAPTSTPPQKP